MAWGKEWVITGTEIIKLQAAEDKNWKHPIAFLIEETGKTLIDLIPKIYGELKTQGSNLVDDQAYLYFQCQDCLDIFDPNTKSFAMLNQKRHEAGWKVYWNMDGMGYKVYCVKCGEDR